MRTLFYIFTILLVTSCKNVRQEEDVTAFFQQMRCGSSPDYAIQLQSTMEPSRWDHVITVHGFTNDGDTAMMLVDCLNNLTESNYRAVQINK